METVLVELINNKALRLLQELENLKILRINGKSADSGKERKKASDYKGILPSDLADKMQSYIRQSRYEWNSSDGPTV